MFSVITNIYNKETKGPTLMEFFTATGKLKSFFFWQLEMFDKYTTDDTAHIDTIFKFLPYTRHQRWRVYGKNLNCIIINHLKLNWYCLQPAVKLRNCFLNQYLFIYSCQII
jgi:hypothetical protein